MIDIYCLSFHFFIFADILGLCLFGFIMRKVCKKFDTKLLPMAIVLLSILTTYLYFFSMEGEPWYIPILFGIYDGIGAVGLHQVFKQTTRYFKFKKLEKNIKEVTSNYRNVSN